MKCRLLVRREAGPSAPDSICTVEGRRRFIEPGTEIEHPQAWMLCVGGFAEPVDDECRKQMQEHAEQSILPPRAREYDEHLRRQQQDFIDGLKAEQALETEADN